MTVFFPYWLCVFAFFLISFNHVSLYHFQYESNFFEKFHHFFHFFCAFLVFYKISVIVSISIILSFTLNLAPHSIRRDSYNYCCSIVKPRTRTVDMIFKIYLIIVNLFEIPIPLTYLKRYYIYFLQYLQKNNLLYQIYFLLICSKIFYLLNL